MGQIRRIHVDVPADAPGFNSLFDAVCAAGQAGSDDD